MTHYELFKEATPGQLAALLTNLTCGILNVYDPQEIRDIFNTYKDCLADEAPQTLIDHIAALT
jgi:hypothetical protein